MSREQVLMRESLRLFKLGNEYVNQGDYDTAQRVLRTAVDIKNSISNRDNLDIALDYYKVGMLSLVVQKTQEAEYFFKNALLWQQSLDENNQDKKNTIAALSLLDSETPCHHIDRHVGMHRDSSGSHAATAARMHVYT